MVNCRNTIMPLYVVNLLQDFDKQFTKLCSCMWFARIHDWLSFVNPKTMTYQNLYMIYQHHDLQELNIRNTQSDFFVIR